MGDGDGEEQVPRARRVRRGCARGEGARPDQVPMAREALPQLPRRARAVRAHPAGVCGTGRRGEAVGVPPVPQGHVLRVRGADADPAGRVGVPAAHVPRVRRRRRGSPGSNRRLQTTRPPRAVLLGPSCRSFLHQCSGREFEAVETTPSGEGAQQLLPPGAVVRVREVPAVRPAMSRLGTRGRTGEPRRRATMSITVLCERDRSEIAGPTYYFETWM